MHISYGPPAAAHLNEAIQLVAKEEVQATNRGDGRCFCPAIQVELLVTVHGYQWVTSGSSFNNQI